MKATLAGAMRCARRRAQNAYVENRRRLQLRVFGRQGRSASGIDKQSLQSYRKNTMSQGQAGKVSCCEPQADENDLRPAEGPDIDDELAGFAKALGHPARVQILRILSRRNSCVYGELVDEISLAQSTISQHVKVLKEAGLIRGEIDGPRICYCLEPRALRRLRVLIAAI